MKNFYITLLILTLLSGCGQMPNHKRHKTVIPEIRNTEYTELIWADEFNGSSLDRSKWNFEYGYVRNEEEQFYTEDNVKVVNGYLTIQAKKEDNIYTSSSILTRGIKTFLYVRIEMRAKLPGGEGVWPAFWTTGDYAKYGWPMCGEIDIMEYVGHTPYIIYSTVHYQGLDTPHISEGGQYASKELHNRFNIYAIEWSESSINFYFNNTLYHTFEISKADSVDGFNPFRESHILRLNLALGGSWGGSIDDHILPQEFVIDYVRVFRKESKLPNRNIGFLPAVLNILLKQELSYAIQKRSYRK